MSEKTVRELAGEIWAEINSAHWRRGDEIDVEVLNAFIEVASGVLARHDGATILNDPDFPVAPLKHGGSESDQKR